MKWYRTWSGPASQSNIYGMPWHGIAMQMQMQTSNSSTEHYVTAAMQSANALLVAFNIAIAPQKFGTGIWCCWCWCWYSTIPSHFVVVFFFCVCVTLPDFCYCRNGLVYIHNSHNTESIFAACCISTRLSLQYALQVTTLNMFYFSVRVCHVSHNNTNIIVVVVVIISHTIHCRMMDGVLYNAQQPYIVYFQNAIANVILMLLWVMPNSTGNVSWLHERKSSIDSLYACVMVQKRWEQEMQALFRCGPKEWCQKMHQIP